MEILIKKISQFSDKKIIKYNKKKNIKILDYGSGFQPVLIFIIYEKLTKIYKKNIIIDCYDFYSFKQLSKLNSHKKLNINFKKISLAKKNQTKYDFALVNDVIHHMGIQNEKLIINLLNDLLTKSKIVFMKDICLNISNCFCSQNQSLRPNYAEFSPKTTIFLYLKPYF